MSSGLFFDDDGVDITMDVLDDTEEVETSDGLLSKASGDRAND